MKALDCRGVGSRSMGTENSQGDKTARADSVWFYSPFLKGDLLLKT